MKKGFWRIFITILCLAMFGVGVWICLSDEQKKAEGVEIYEELQKEHTSILGNVDLSATIPVDFPSLKEINEDIYAWIDIPDTNVHYPIVQSDTDDSYYLEHTIEHVKGLPGSIYTESINRKDFQDYITLIYGHDMHDGSMFKHLHKFSEAKFFEEHDTITIYTEEAILKYKVLAAVAYDKRHIMYNFDQSKFEDREEFVQSLHQSKNWKNQYREGVEVNEDSKLVVLSTCITGQPDKRWIVVGVSAEN